MNQGPTFRDHFLSIYQSAVADLGRQLDPRGGSPSALESAGASEGPSLESAAQRIAAQLVASRTTERPQIPFVENATASLEAMSLTENVEICAALGLRYLVARVSGDRTTAQLIKSELLPGSKCDANWITTLEEYLKYFGADGKRRDIPYIKPNNEETNPITIKSNARVGLIGDWGTGAEPAKRILRQIKAQKPDILIHLGDIYYSGTDAECRINFESILDDVLERAKIGIPVYTLAGNHDMYSGGVGYYALLKRLNKPPMVQPASFFCLRTEDHSWQLLAMDTGQHDHSPAGVTEMLTYVDQDERDWHEQRIREFPGKTILLSHHQFFSAFSQIGKRSSNDKLSAFNPELRRAFEQFRATGRDIAAWFWGHEHNLSVYKPYLGLRRGRCLGHAAIPVFVKDDPYNVRSDIDDPPGIVETAKLSTAGDVYTNGFAMLLLEPSIATAEYFEDRGGTATKIHSETID
jgi:predicted phosphodiesterase